MKLLLKYPDDEIEEEETYDGYYIDFTEQLTDIIKERNPNGFWYITGEQIGWQNRSGTKACIITEGKELVESIAPNSEFTIEIYKGLLNGLVVKSYHHDSPMGEIYTFKPISEKTYDEEMKS